MSSSTKGGALEFDIIANTGQIDGALDETKKQIQGFTDTTVESGENLKAILKNIAAQFEAILKNINDQILIHEYLISDLEKKYANFGKNDASNTEPTDITTQSQKDYAKAKKEYDDYLQSKMDADLLYQTRRKELETAIEKETNADQKKILETQLKTLDTTQLLKQTKDYDALVAEYKSYQQKREAIAAEYDKKIHLASQKDDSDTLVPNLEKAKQNALSELALNEIKSSDTFTELFANLDNLTVSKMIELRNTLENEWANTDLNPENLEELRKKINEVNDKIQEKNPFKGLADAIKRYGDAEDKVTKKNAFKDIFGNVASSIDIVKGSFDSVTGALTDMGFAGDEITQELLGDIGKMIGSAGQLAKGIASGDILSIVQGSVSLISSAFQVFNFGDRRAERAIKKHEEAVKELEQTYKALERAVDKALGESVYENQKALINNLREQKMHVEGMLDAEESKKKDDKDKINQYEEQISDLGYQIEDTIAEITESITQTSAKDLATQLSDAIANAYSEGFNSSSIKNAIEEVTNQVLTNAVKNALKKQFLEQQLQGAVKQLQYDMGFDGEGGGSFDGLTPAEQQRFKDRVNSIAQGYAEALKLYEDLFKDVDDTGASTASLSGAIKGASQESIDLLAGQTNAVRVNQVQQIEALRQQLLHLANIDGKLSISNQYLEQIERNTSGRASDPLRAQGITM